MKTTTEAAADLRKAFRVYVSAMFRPVSQRIEKCTQWARRLPHKVAWWMSRGVPSAVKNQWKSWRYEIERQRVSELYDAELYDQYVREKEALRRKWGV
jgi:hypothetical protein